MGVEHLRRTGRAPGSRNRFSQRLLEDALANWEKNGTAAMEDMRHDDPGGYVRAMFSILPKEYTVEAVSSGLSPEERLELIDRLKAHLLTRQEPPMLIEAKIDDELEPEPTRARED
jgi:hypothetical protein